MAPNCKRSDAGNLDMPQRSRKVLPLIDKVCVYKKKHSIYRVRERASYAEGKE